MALIAGQAVLALAKKTIPQHTVIGKAIGSTNTGKGIDLAKVAQSAGAGEKVVGAISAIGQIGGKTTSLSTASTGYASTVANSLAKAPAPTLVANNLSGGASPSTYSSIAPANPSATDAGSDETPDNSSGSSSKSDDTLKWVLIGAGVLFLLSKK